MWDYIQRHVLAIAGGLLILLCLLAVASGIEGNKQFEAQMAAEMQQCKESGETEFTCRAYVNSLRAARDSKNASIAASAAAGFSGATMGLAVGNNR